MPSVKGELAFPTAPKLTNGCRQPGVLPQKDLSRGEVETYWSRDRAALSSCYANTQAYRKHLETLENSFSPTGR